MQHNFKIILLAGVLLFMTAACCDDKNSTHITSNFESGSIGEVNKLSHNEWELSLADDNDNPELPKHWRTWWYVRLNNTDTSSPVVIHLKNRGWPYYYTPVYSYDQKIWHRFSENEVSQTSEFELKIEKKFSSSNIWIARFYPYSYSDLIAYIKTIQNNVHVKIETPSKTQDKNPIYLLTLSDFDIDDSAKKRVWIHARTHPAETGPSFLLEGFIDFLLSNNEEAKAVLSQFIFHIVPMQNIDGVIAGNYRTTPANENLEVMWYSDPDDPLKLTEDAPVEVVALHKMIRDLSEQPPAFSIALNLHASNSEPDIRPFFFPHFGSFSSEADGYTSIEASLWNKQIRFIKSMGLHCGENMLEPTPLEGGSSFATKSYPESWWWKNFQDEVMAITLEITYGKAGYSPDWITPDDLRSLGESLAPGLRDYADTNITFAKSAVTPEKRNLKYKLKYPELYPPNAPDEMKE